MDPPDYPRHGVPLHGPHRPVGVLEGSLADLGDERFIPPFAPGAEPHAGEGAERAEGVHGTPPSAPIPDVVHAHALLLPPPTDTRGGDRCEITGEAPKFG